MKDVIYISVHPIDDFHAGGNIGMNTIWKRYNHWGETNIPYSFDSMEELPIIIETIFSKVNM